MAHHNQIGAKGEQIAKEMLEAKGYQILEQNWRFSRAEVDLIAKDGEILVFVEVKTRSYDYFGQPEEFVTSTKEAFMAQAASAYMDKIGHDWEIRFDIIGILYRNQASFRIKHIEDAFFPGLE